MFIEAGESGSLPLPPPASPSPFTADLSSSLSRSFLAQSLVGHPAARRPADSGGRSEARSTSSTVAV
jgi:hypothetical protein